MLKKLFQITSCFLLLFHCAFATELDSLKHLLKETNERGNTEHVFEVNRKMGKYFYKLEQYEEALPYLLAADTLAVSAIPIQNKIKNQYDIGKTYHKLNQYQLSLEVFYDIIENNTTKLTYPLLPNTFGQIAKTYQTLGNYEMAYDYQVQALGLYEDKSDTAKIAKTHYDIGNIFFYQDSFEEALVYYERALKYYKLLENPHMMYACFAALGGVYEHLEKIDTSLKYNFQALKLAEELAYKSGVAYATHNIGADYIHKEEYEKALTYFQQSLELKQELADKWGEAGTLRAMGYLYIQKKYYKKALAVLNECLQISKSIEAKPRVLEAYQYLALTHEAMGDYKKAFSFQTKQIALSDSLLNDKTLQEMSDRKVQYEMDKKEKQKQKELTQKDKQISSLYRNTFLMIIGLLLVIVWMLLSRYKNQKIHTSLLQQKNSEIESQNLQLVFTNQELERSNKDLEQFAYAVSHDLKEPLRMIGGYATLLDRRYKQQLDEEAHDYMGFISEAVQRMYRILGDILTYSQIEKQAHGLERVNTQVLVESIVERLNDQISPKNALIHIGRLPQITANSTQITALFQNLLNNALKFCEKKEPEIYIDCQRKPGLFVFSIQDNGIGIEAEYKNKIFQMFQRLHNRKTYEGSGIGLAICKKIVEQHKGNIWVESIVGRGSTFYFTVPAEETTDLSLFQTTKNSKLPIER